MSRSPEERQEDFRNAITSDWYAACESGHAFWSGPDRKTYKEAKADADQHDKQMHGGEETAVVLGGTFSANVSAPVNTSQLRIDAPTEEILEGCVGKHISKFCLNKYADDSHNHCAHFIGHVLRLAAGHTCAKETGGSEFGASIKVHEVFASCATVGKWGDLPAVATWGLIFIVHPLNVDLAKKTMQNVPNKHVGIFFGGSRTVYQYKNAVRQVVKQTTAEFGLHYPAPDNGLFYGIP